MESYEQSVKVKMPSNELLQPVPQNLLIRESKQMLISYQNIIRNLSHWGGRMLRHHHLCYNCSAQVCVLYFSVCCSCDAYLTELLIQKPIKMLLRNFASFSGHIALCFCKSLSCFTRDSQKSLVVAIYSQIKSRNC